MEVWRGIHEGLNAVIVNPSVIIGPGMWMGPGRQLFYAIQEGLKYYPLGSSGYVDVRDVARIMVSLSGKPVTGERFILNAGQMTHREFMQHLATAFGKQGPEIPVTPLLASAAVISESIRAFFSGSAPRINRRTFKIASENLSYSNNKIREALGFTFIPIEDSVKSSVQLFRDHCR
jgi:nucleoside-diphosphate-sugar epimerase